VQTTFASVILDVEQGKADLGLDYFYSTTRAQHVYYSSPFLQTVASIFTLKSTPYTGPNNLTKIGGVVGEVWQPYIQKQYGSKSVFFPTDVAAATAMLNGQVQGFVDGSDFVLDPPLAAQASNISVNLLQSGVWGMPQSAILGTSYNFTSCGNKSLATTLTSWMTQLQASGQLTQIFSSNNVSTPEQPPLTLPTEDCSAG